MKLIFKPLFQKYLLFCFKNTLAVSLIIFLEQTSIFVSILVILQGLFSESSKNEQIKTFFDTIQKISPINFVKNSLNCVIHQQANNQSVCTAKSLIFLLQILITLLIITFLGFFVLQEILQNNRNADNTSEKLDDKENSNDCISNSLTFCFINLLDFTIHFCSLGIFYFNFNEIFGFLNLLNSTHYASNFGAALSSVTISDAIIPLSAFAFFGFYSYIYISFIKNINLIIQYKKELSTHYDHIFSVKYDLTNFFLKIFISLQFAFETNKIISDKSLTFFKLLVVSVFCAFNVYMIYANIFAKKILYLANHKYNIIRIFLSYLSFFSVVIILAFRKIFFQNFYVLCICFFIALIIASFMARVTNEKNYVAIYSTDNYILQLIYVLNVKYNASEKELNAEVSNVMFHHKNYCIFYKNCDICKMENFDFDNFLFNYSKRIKEMLKNKNRAYALFQKYDINTFDIIKLLIIENLDKNKIIKLIYKARRILEKYEVQKRYDNNYFNILIYNDYMKRLITKNQVLKFKIIQCYEDTSLHINEALAVLETMLLSLNNGEKQLFGKSSDLYELKNKISKNVLFLSYYQNYFVDTYSIIIYRFIYKNLFNCDINDYVTIYNFEEIKDLINYMFNNEKLIQIKLNFNNNSMKLLRLGKDLIHYRNKNFEDLIPADFKDHCCEQLIKKVKSSENEENKSFEYIIIDADNSLKSLKLNFSILASFKLDEVILIGQYDIVDEDLVLLKKGYSLSNSYSAFEQNGAEAQVKLGENALIDKNNSNNGESTTTGDNLFNNDNNNNDSRLINFIGSKKQTDKVDVKNSHVINNAINNETVNINSKYVNNYENTISDVVLNNSNNNSNNNNQSKSADTNLTVASAKRTVKKKQFITDDEKSDKNNYNKKSTTKNKKTMINPITTTQTKSKKSSNNIKNNHLKQNSFLTNKHSKNDESFYTDKNFLQIFDRVDKSKSSSLRFSGGFVAQDVEIVFFSANLQSAFFIKSYWLTKIKTKYNLPFPDIFEKVNQIQRRTVEEGEKANNCSICAINYDKYFLIYQRLVNFVEEEINNEEIKENLKRFRHISKSAKMSYYKFEFLYEIKIEKKEILYLLFKIKQIQPDDREMQLISVDPIIKNNLINKLTQPPNTAKDKSNDFAAQQQSQLEIEKLNSMMIKEKDNNQSVSISSNSFSATSKQNIMMAQDSSRKTISSNDQRMNKFTIFSLIFCIFLIVYCLFFLVMGMINNNNIRKLYLIRNSFNDFRYFFYHTSMNFFFNLGINKNDADFLNLNTPINNYINNNNNNNNKNINNSAITSSTSSTDKNIESLFFQKFKDNKSININISKYVVEELSVKLNMLRTIYVNLQNAIYSSHYKDSLDVIFNHKTTFFQISTVSGQISVSAQEKFFFETINIFFNHGKVIVENMSENKFIFLSIINAKNNKVNFSSQSGAGATAHKLTETQIKMYEIILNYINFYKNFIEIGELMNQFFNEALTDVFNSTYLLSFILMGIHLFLFFGGIFIVKFLHKIISQNDKMLCSSNDEGNIRFMREKLKSVKNLSLLFVENPRNLVISISKKRAEFVKKLYKDTERKKGFAGKKPNSSSSGSKYDAFANAKSNLNLVDNFDENFHNRNNNALGSGNNNDTYVDLLSGADDENSESYKNNNNNKSKVSYLDKFVILVPFLQLVLVLFVLYYLYSLIFYFIFRNSYNDFILTSDFSNQNIELDNKMMNNINLLSTMMLLNKTEFDVSFDLSGKQQQNKLMMGLLTNILQIRTEITKYKKTNEKFKSIDNFEQNLMNCTYIYNNLNDSIFFELEKVQGNANLGESLTALCNSFSFMKTQRLDSIFDEISYNSLYLYNLYDTSDRSYNDIVSIYENFMLYDVFLIFIFIFRPIRKFSGDFIYNNIIILSSNNYLVFTIVYLILNILVDLFIFYIINRMVVKKISDINKHLNNMITCISFKFSNSNKEKGD